MTTSRPPAWHSTPHRNVYCDPGRHFALAADCTLFGRYHVCRACQMLLPTTTAPMRAQEIDDNE